MRLDGCYATLALLLCASGALGSDQILKTSHEVQSFVLSQGDAADAGQDAQAADLTDSIQGMFSDAPVAPEAATSKTPPAPAIKKSQPSVKKVPAAKASQAKAVVKPKVAATKLAAAKVAKVSEPKAAATKPAAKVAQMAAKSPAPKVAQMAAKSPAQKPLKKVVAKLSKAKAAPAAVLFDGGKKATTAAVPKAHKAKSLATKKPNQNVAKNMKSKAPQPVSKPSKTKVVYVQRAKVHSKATEAPKVVKAVSLKPKQVPKQAAKVANTKTTATGVEKTAAKAVPVHHPKASKPISKMQVAEKASESSAGVPLTKLQVAQKANVKVAKVAKVAKVVKVAKAIVKVASAKDKNLSTALHTLKAVAATLLPNASASTKPKENSTKAIEEAVVSLPMSSFALETPAATKIPKVKKFPGNATQKAAWDKKETSLENEIATLTARLANTSASLPQHVVPAAPKATGSFSAQPALEAKTVDVPKAAKFMAAHAPEPMQPIRQDDKPKATWPAMNSVAAPVALHIVDAGAPPQKEEVQAQGASAKKVTMGSTFTGTPATKVQSVLALDNSVEQQSFAVDEDSSVSEESPALVAATPEVAPTISFWGWCSSFFPWGPTTAAAPAAPKPVAGKTSLIDTSPQNRLFKQNMERTAQAAQDESQQIIQVGDAWSQMENDDSKKEEEVHREDEAERERARTLEAPMKETKTQLQGRHGADMSGFWSKLEKEDYGIEKTIDTDNMGEYERLTQAQTDQVSKAAEQVKNNNLHTDRVPLLKHNDDARLAIHEPWLRRETRDVAAERKIHDSPDLQMLQLRHQHHRQ